MLLCRRIATLTGVALLGLATTSMAQSTQAQPVPAQPAQAGARPAQAQPSGGHTPQLLTALLASESTGKLRVTTASFKDGGEIPKANTQYGGNHFPGLTWSRGPQGTKSYVVVVQGKSLERPQSGTTIHLFLFNVPGNVTHIDADMKSAPAGATAGPNLHGGDEVYVGPHTHTAEKHGYHFEVFALDTTLPVASPVSFQKVADAMQGHVRASGEVMGWAAKTDDEN